MLPLLLATAGAGVASSLTSLPPASADASPSFVALGEPDAAEIDAQPLTSETFAIGASMIAYGEDAIPAASEPVASIAATQPRWSPDAMPLVIRGGITGDLFSEPAVAATPDLQEDASPDEAAASEPPPGPDTPPEPIILPN